MFDLDLSNCVPNTQVAVVLITLFNGLVYDSMGGHPYITIAETVRYRPNVLKLVRNINTCREAFTHVLGAHYVDKSRYINKKTRYGVSPMTKDIRILLMPRVGNLLIMGNREFFRKREINQPKLEEFNSIRNIFDKKISLVENMLHIFEEEVGFKQSTIAPCSWRNIDKFDSDRLSEITSINDKKTLTAFLDILKIMPTYAFDMDKRFLSTPHSLSLYTLLIRTIFTTKNYQIFENITDIDSLKNTFEKYKKQNDTGDAALFTDYKLFFEYCKNMKNLYDTFNPVKNFFFPNFSNEGITNLCRGKASAAPGLSNRFNAIKNRMNRKSTKQEKI